MLHNRARQQINQIVKTTVRVSTIQSDHSLQFVTPVINRFVDDPLLKFFHKVRILSLRWSKLEIRMWYMLCCRAPHIQCNQPESCPDVRVMHVVLWIVCVSNLCHYNIHFYSAAALLPMQSAIIATYGNSVCLSVRLQSIGNSAYKIRCKQERYVAFKMRQCVSGKGSAPNPAERAHYAP